ncbi:hypothetical protein M3J09_012460 [Ascochyta lentis]
MYDVLEGGVDLHSCSVIVNAGGLCRCSLHSPYQLQALPSRFRPALWTWLWLFTAADTGGVRPQPEDNMPWNVVRGLRPDYGSDGCRRRSVHRLHPKTSSIGGHACLHLNAFNNFYSFYSLGRSFVPSTLRVVVTPPRR